MATNDHCLSNVLVGYTLLWEVRHAPTGEPGWARAATSSRARTAPAPTSRSCRSRAPGCRSALGPPMEAGASTPRPRGPARAPGIGAPAEADGKAAAATGAPGGRRAGSGRVAHEVADVSTDRRR